jgi:hypothetical protein
MERMQIECILDRNAMGVSWRLAPALVCHTWR